METGTGTGTGTEALATGLQQMHMGQEVHPLGGGDRSKKKEPLELEEVCSMHGGHKIRSLSWSPCPCNGAKYMLASGGDSKTIIWHCKDSDSQWSILTELSNGRKGFIESCAWSLDGKLLATGGLNSNIAIWEHNNEAEDPFKLIAQIHGPQEQIVKSLSWNSKQLLLSCSNDGAICIIGKNNGAYVVKARVCECGISPTSCAIWHPNDETFAVAGYKKTQIYNTQTLGDGDVIAYRIHTINSERSGHKSGITGISFWDDGQFMASAGADSTMKFWRIVQPLSRRSRTTFSTATGKELGSNLVSQYKIPVDARGGFLCCDWSRCHTQSIGYLIASSCLFNDIYIFVQHQKSQRLAYSVVVRKLDAHSGPISDLKWHPKDARLLASAGSKGIKIWKVKGEVEYVSDPSTYAHANLVVAKRRTAGTDAEEHNAKRVRSFP